VIRLPLIALAVCLPVIATAQGFDGAYISVETLGQSSGDNTGDITYSGGAQVSFGPGFALSGDLTSYGFETMRGNATSATLHGSYALNPISAVGAFYGFDRYDGDQDAFYGVEGQASFSGATVEAFLGQAEVDTAEATMYGLSGQFVFGTIGLTADYAAIDDDRSVNRFSLGGEWYMGLGPTFYAEWGKLGGDIDEDYLALGVRIGIGPTAGTTFGPRSVTEITAGF
jgi:hypothetical protein